MGDRSNSAGIVRQGEQIVDHTDTESSDVPEANALLPRLRVIEDQPLDQRAAAFAQLHDELQAALEDGSAPARHV